MQYITIMFPRIVRKEKKPDITAIATTWKKNNIKESVHGL